MKRSPLSWNLLLCLYFANKLVPTIVSALAIYLGYKLFVLGVTGQASLVVDSHSVKGQLLNAAPGLFFAVGGVAALIVTVWKGSNFTFERRLPDDFIAMCRMNPGLRFQNMWEGAKKGHPSDSPP